MLTASVLGTVLGDDASLAVGEGPASIGLTLLLVVVQLVTRGEVRSVFTYWSTVAVAWTAGTAIGDWLAENRIFNIGVPLSMLLTGTAFAVLLLWRSWPDADLVGRGETGGHTVSMTWLGETSPDAAESALDGCLVGTGLFGVLPVVLVWAQIRAPAFNPWLYWATVVASTTFGTTPPFAASKRLLV